MMHHHHERPHPREQPTPSDRENRYWQTCTHKQSVTKENGGSAKAARCYPFPSLLLWLSLPDAHISSPVFPRLPLHNTHRAANRPLQELPWSHHQARSPNPTPRIWACRKSKMEWYEQNEQAQGESGRRETSTQICNSWSRDKSSCVFPSSSLSISWKHLLFTHTSHHLLEQTHGRGTDGGLQSFKLEWRCANETQFVDGLNLLLQVKKYPKQIVRSSCKEKKEG